MTSAGVFDFDGAVFKGLLDNRPANDLAAFYSYVKYHLSHHRIMWSEFAI